MKKDNSVYLKQIAEYIDEIEEYVGGGSFGEFEKMRMLQDAVIRKIELIGETARRLRGYCSVGAPLAGALEGEWQRGKGEDFDLVEADLVSALIKSNGAIVIQSLYLCGC